MDRPLLAARSHRPIASTCFTQFKILVWKNKLISVRNWKGTLGILLTPVLVCFILSSFQAMSDSVLSQDNPAPPSHTIPLLQRCQVGDRGTNGPPCKTLVYAPAVPWVDALMETVCEQNNLVFGTDVVALPGSTHHSNTTWCIGNINQTVPSNEYIAPWFHVPNEKYIAKQLEHGKLTYPCNWFRDNTTLQNYLLATPNKTQNAVLFTSAYIDASLPTDIPGLPNVHLPTGYNISVGYTLFYNATISKFPILESNHGLETMQALENAILSKRTNKPNAKISAKYAPFPSPPPRLTGYDVVSQQGGIWFFLPGCIIFFSLFMELVAEKELKLKLGMQFMGMQETAYWASWIVSGLVFSALTTVILIASGSVAGYSTFVNTDLAVLATLYFTFHMSMVGLSFFLAAIVNSRKSAQTIGYSFILVGFVFQTIICTGYGSLIDLLFSNDVAWWVNVIRYVLQCYPPFSFAKSFFCISDIAGKQYHYHEGTVDPGHHFYWFNGTQTRHKSLLGHAVVVPPMFDSIDLMLLDMVGFFLVAWYLDNVLESDTGNSKPPWFCITREYWGCCRHRQISQQERSTVPGMSGTSDIAKHQPALVVTNLVKEYGGCRCWPFRSSSTVVRAVDGMSFSIDKDSIYCLLGHNGAGKSTTIGILTGLFPLTSGTAELFGKDVSKTEDMRTIQSWSGVCPQHDILWQELTALEHALLFAQIKGVPDDQIDEECKARLDYMGLAPVQHDRASTFSGGMKRRLSVAIATIGDPPFLVLDEPTTGMDVVNRRVCWRLIQQLKKDRLIVVTTHSMEEADVLGDRVGIMAHGKLACSGTPLSIKNEFGNGYTLSLVVKGVDTKECEQSLAQVLRGIQQPLNSALPSVSQRDGKAVKISIPKEHVHKLPQVLQYLESVEGLLINEWGVSDATLESAFLKITAENGFTYQVSTNESKEEHREDSMHDVPFDGQHHSTASPTPTMHASLKGRPCSQSFGALLRKNFILQSRQRGSSCCQVITPILVMCLLCLLQAIIRTQIPPSQSILVPSIPYPLNAPSLAAAVTRGDKSDARGGQCLEFFWWTHDSKQQDDQAVGNLTAFIPQRNCSLKQPWKDNVVQVPYFKQQSNWTLIQSKLFFDLSLLNREPREILENINLPYPNFITPDGAVHFHSIDPQNLSFTFSINDASIALYHRPNGFTRLASQHASLFSDSVQLFDQGKMALFSMIADAHIEYSSSSSGGVPSKMLPIEHELLNTIDSLVGIKMVASMPMIEQPNLLAIVEIFGSFLYPMALTLQLPVYIFIIVLEKETKLRELQKTMGMSMSLYWLASITFNLMLYSAVAAFFWIVGVAVDLRFFAQTGWDLLLLFFMLWGFSLSSMSMLISSLVSSRRVATVIGYMVVLFGNGIGLILSDGIYGNLPDLSVASAMPLWMFLNPQFAMIRFVYKTNFRCAALLDCYGSLNELNMDDEVTVCLLFLLFDAVWIALLALYLDQVVPSQWGIHKSPCFCFRPYCRDDRSGGGGGGGGCGGGYRLVGDGLVGDECEDRDVQQERVAIANAVDANRSKYVVCMENLRKEFHLHTGMNSGKTKVAVDSFTGGIQGGELFGLLGENGAGKSTLVNMLVGTITPTKGQAAVAGFDIKTNIDEAHLRTGICPQHDVLWDTLTVVEHLTFYANMKKVKPGATLRNHVRQSLIEVGLLKYSNRTAAQLSGGMKRRLSIAIAMVGNSEVVFLDEPTTGLDPSSRRAIWKIITNAKNQKNRAMILTTHLMDEAESLCTRIGIMTHGRLRCVAGQQRLKNKYGGGYKVTLNYEEKHWYEVEQLMKKECGSSVGYRFDGQSSWKLGGEKKVSTVFEILNREAGHHGVTDWALGQTSLDDVFAFIVQKYNK